MPTATATTTSPSAVLSLKASPTVHAHASTSSSAATLRSLYPRAARAFLQRDVALTHSLLSSAFSLLPPPPSPAAVNDALASQRRKWDILRITFETTLYASPPAAHDPERLPPALRANLMLSPEPLVATLHSRSLQLFTPADPPQKPSSAFLPSQILVTLVLASLKLDCTDVGRGMVEDWLAKRHGQEDAPDDPKGYAKVLELYCLHVLPRLQDWDYAEDFLEYERELPADVRQHYATSLRQLRAEAAANANANASAHAHAALPAEPLPSSSTSSSRSVSPSPSDSSSASSSSTQTATPLTRRAAPDGIAPFTPSQSPTPKPHDERHHSPHSASSQSIASTATSRTVTPHNAQRAAKAKRSARTRPAAPAREPSASSASASAPNSVIRRASFADPAAATGARAPSTLALLRASVTSVVSRARVAACVVLFVVLPLVSFVLRVRRRRRLQGQVGAGGGTVDAVRRRLRGVEVQGGLVGRVWEEVARAVVDTVKMAGRGLV